METNELEWWGYKHNCGSYQAKRYFDQIDITEAQESPFVESVVGPFKANGREEALEKVKELTKKPNVEDNILNISDDIKRYVVKYRVLKPLSYGEENVDATDKWNAYDIFMNAHQYYDVVDIVLMKNKLSIS